MKEKILSIYSPQTIKPYLLIYTREPEPNLIDTIHLFCNRYEERSILDALSVFHEKMTTYSHLKEKLLKWAEMHLENDFKLIRHDFFSENGNITQKLDRLLHSLEKVDKDFIRVKVL